MYMLTVLAILVVYRLIGVGSRAYQFEIILLWAVWLTGVCIAGYSVQVALFFALLCWFSSSILGGALVRAGFKKWTTSDMWPPWRGSR